MFCGRCGAKLEESARFCPQCGAKIGGGSKSAFPNITQAVDFQNIKSKSAHIAQAVNLQNIKSKSSSVLSSLKSLDKMKILYGVIISLVLVILFWAMTASVLNPAKKVKAKVTYAGEPYTTYSTGTFYKNTYYQEISIFYNGKRCTETRKLAAYTPSFGQFESFGNYSVGDMVTAYIVNGNLTLDKDTAKVNVIGAGFSIILLLCSMGSCAWFAVQFYKKRNT